MSSSILLDERVVAVQPALVREFGLTEAVVLQQVHWHVKNSADAEDFDGFRWVPMPYQQFSNETGLTQRQVRGAVVKLEEANVVLSCQPEIWQRRKWYRIDYTHVRLAALRPSDESVNSNGPIGRLTSAGSGASSSTKRNKNGGATRKGKNPRSESDGIERTAEAFFAQAARNNERIFGQTRERSPEEREAERLSGLAHIAEIKRRRAEGRAS